MGLSEPALPTGIQKDCGSQVQLWAAEENANETREVARAPFESLWRVSIESELLFRQHRITRTNKRFILKQYAHCRLNCDGPHTAREICSLLMSLFKRPSWATTQVSVVEGDDSLFSHSSRSYSEIIAEDQRKKRERAEKERLKREKKDRKVAEKGIKDEHIHGAPKRRRITAEEGEGLLGLVGLSSAATPESVDEAIGGQVDRDIPQRRSPRFNTIDKVAVAAPASAATRAPVIDLEDSEGEIQLVQPSAKEQLEDQPIEDESDEELAELARQVRARRRLSERDGSKASQSRDSDTQSPELDVGKSQSPSRSQPDPVVKLFITSPIEGTKPLIVFRKLSQRLQEIREVWCKRQEFSKEMSDKVFLIHKMRRVYDVTTCKSLGLAVAADGHTIIMKGAEMMDGVDQVHLEAVTDQVYAELKAARERDARKLPSLLDSIDESPTAISSGQRQLAEPEGEEKLTRILLKARGQKDFRLKVRPTTLVSKILRACREPFNVQDGQSMYLEFDGERLDDNAEMQVYGIEDLDNIDVHIL